jgi:elongation factor P
MQMNGDCGKILQLVIAAFPYREPRLSGSLLPTGSSQDSSNQDPLFKEKVLLMAIPATQMRPGMIIKHNNDLHLVFTVEHRTPGNLRAFIQAKLRNVRTGAMFEHRFRSGDAIEKITVDEIPMEYLYQDGDSFCFMNTENYEQVHLNRDVLGDSVDYLTPNLQIRVEFYDGKPVGIELPQTVELTVVETEPGLKSATASSVTKPAKTETGLVVQVPPFINEGEKIRVDTAEGAYLSRA